MALLHLRRATTAKLRLGNYRKVAANQRERQESGGENGLQPSRNHITDYYTTLTTELKEHQAELKKAEGVIKNSVAHKHQPTLEGKTAQKMWEILKTKFQHISPMRISRLILDTTKI